MTIDVAGLLGDLIATADQAGDAIMKLYGVADIKTKADRSPVTEADEAAEALILARLAELTPDIPVVAEESIAKGLSPGRIGAQFWLVDPLDGTKEFISGNGEFTVNIALIRDGLPTLGVVGAPTLNNSGTIDFFASPERSECVVPSAMTTRPSLPG